MANLEFDNNEFKEWLNSDNVIKVVGGYKTQCNQYRCKFTRKEAKEYFIKEFLKN